MSTRQAAAAIIASIDAWVHARLAAKPAQFTVMIAAACVTRQAAIIDA